MQIYSESARNYGPPCTLFQWSMDGQCGAIKRRTFLQVTSAYVCLLV